MAKGTRNRAYFKIHGRRTENAALARIRRAARRYSVAEGTYIKFVQLHGEVTPRSIAALHSFAAMQEK